MVCVPILQKKGNKAAAREETYHWQELKPGTVEISVHNRIFRLLTFFPTYRS